MEREKENEKQKWNLIKIDLISQDTLTCEIKERILLFHVNSHAFQGIFYLFSLKMLFYRRFEIRLGFQLGEIVFLKSEFVYS